MIPKLGISAFSEKYGTTEHRKDLLESLIDFMDALKADIGYYRVLVYGSYITHKIVPNDVDVMITAITTPKDKGYAKYIKLQELANPEIHVYTLDNKNASESNGDLPLATE